MIVVNAQMWPGGQQAQSREIMNVTISNQGTDKDGDNYFAHVLSRPAPQLGVVGYEADVEVRGHEHASGLTPLLMSVLLAAHNTGDGFKLPQSRTLARLTLTELDDFDARLKGRK